MDRENERNGWEDRKVIKVKWEFCVNFDKENWDMIYKILAGLEKTMGNGFLIYWRIKLDHKIVLVLLLYSNWKY